jgi:hypothetical protein
MSWPKSTVFILVAAAFLMFLAALWVPIRIDFYERYLNANLFLEVRPRALLGTIGNLLRLGPVGFNYLKYVALYCWLSLIVCQIYQSVLSQITIERKDFFVFFGLCLIFAFSTVTVMTYGPGFIDVAPYALVALAVIFVNRIGESISWPLLLAINLLLVLAVLAHEKSTFDIAILFVWVLGKKGIRQALIYLAPSILISALFLFAVSSKGASGTQPQEYANILLSGFVFASQHSLNLWGIISGGGALWGLYFVLSYYFINDGNSRAESTYRFLIVSLMVLVCLATLLVAADTNRMIGLMWLPTILLIKEVNIRSIFQSSKSGAGLVSLCLLQFVNPPILMYNNGVVPFNCYSLTLVGYLPAEENVARLKMGPFGMYALSRPDLTRSLQESCSGVAEK